MGPSRIGATAEECRRTFPGDGLLEEAIATWTHGVTVTAPPNGLAVARADGGGPGRVVRMPRGPMLALARAGHRVMQAGQLRGIRRRAEALP